MTQPVRPPAPDPALRTDPTTFVENAEANLKYQLGAFPDWVQAMAGYMEGISLGIDPGDLGQVTLETTQSLVLTNSAGDTLQTAPVSDIGELFALGDLNDVSAASVPDGHVLIRSNGTWTTQPHERPLGYGQTWQDVTVSRSRNVVYQNTTGQPVQLLVQSDGISPDGQLFASSDQSNWVAVGHLFYEEVSDEGSYYSYPQHTSAAIIPPNDFYRMTGGFGKWMELRSS